jgi:hypothetical protein
MGRLSVRSWKDHPRREPLVRGIRSATGKLPFGPTLNKTLPETPWICLFRFVKHHLATLSHLSKHWTVFFVGSATPDISSAHW